MSGESVTMRADGLPGITPREPVVRCRDCAKTDELPDGSLLIDGSLPIDEVEELIGFKPEESDECETAGGLLLTLFDRIPKTGDVVTLHGRKADATFTVVDMDRHRIDKISVLVSRHC